MKRKFTVTVVPLHTNNDLDYWLSRSETERTEAVEFLRQQWWATQSNDPFPRMQKVLTFRKMDAAL